MSRSKATSLVSRIVCNDTTGKGLANLSALRLSFTCNQLDERAKTRLTTRGGDKMLLLLKKKTFINYDTSLSRCLSRILTISWNCSYFLIAVPAADITDLLF